MRIEKSVRINTAPDKVWKVFTNPVISRKMGGSYKTDWTPGSFFGWQSLSGAQITYGRVLEYRPGEYLKHELFNGKEQSEVTSIISYATTFKNDHTILFATEELSEELNDAELGEVLSGWEAALGAVKKLAESV